MTVFTEKSNGFRNVSEIKNHNKTAFYRTSIMMTEAAVMAWIK